MPFVNVKITENGVSAEQKEELIKGITDLLANVLGKNPKSVMVLIEEINSDNWGIGGESVTNIRKNK
jgi:4-oxalocrotonate tautomerase